MKLVGHELRSRSAGKATAGYLITALAAFAVVVYACTFFSAVGVLCDKVRQLVASDRKVVISSNGQIRPAVIRDDF